MYVPVRLVNQCSPANASVAPPPNTWPEYSMSSVPSGTGSGSGTALRSTAVSPETWPKMPNTFRNGSTQTSNLMSDSHTLLSTSITSVSTPPTPGSENARLSMS